MSKDNNQRADLQPHVQADRDITIVLPHGLGGRMFASQRALILALSLSNLLSAPQLELLEGVNNLCDAIADQAKEQGEDCLMRGSVNHPDLRAHIRQEILAAIPAQLPQSREELADIISSHLAGAPATGETVINQEPSEALRGAERLLAPFDTAYLDMTRQVMELTRGKSRPELEELLAASETVLNEGYELSHTTIFRVASEVRSRVQRRLMYPCPGELEDLGEQLAGTRIIRAECHSDDQCFKVEFNALQWLEQASKEEIVGLAAIGYQGDLESDAVALFMQEHDAQIAEMFRYIGRHTGMGFECSVEERDVVKWLHANRQEIYVALIEAGHLTDMGGEFFILHDETTGLFYSYVQDEIPLEWRNEAGSWVSRNIESIPDTASHPKEQIPADVFETIGRHYTEAFESAQFGQEKTENEG